MKYNKEKGNKEQDVYFHWHGRHKEESRIRLEECVLLGCVGCCCLNKKFLIRDELNLLWAAFDVFCQVFAQYNKCTKEIQNQFGVDGDHKMFEIIAEMILKLYIYT